jgi:hypothetical protein
MLSTALEIIGRLLINILDNIILIPYTISTVRDNPICKGDINNG